MIQVYGGRHARSGTQGDLKKCQLCLKPSAAVFTEGEGSQACLSFSL